jgi:hypothetical protein
MATAEPAQPINPRTLSGLRQLLAAELRGLVRTCFRAFWMTTLCFAVPCFLYFVVSYVRGYQERQEPLTPGMLALALVVYAGMALVYGGQGGLAAAVISGLWRLFGGWMFLPVGVTLAVFLGLGWLFEGVVGQQLEELVTSLVVSGGQHGFPNTAAVLSGFRVAHAGGPIVALLLLLALPFLLMDAIVILLSPLVLWDLALLALLVGALFLLATTLTLGICLPVLGWSLVKRVRARHRFGAADPQPTYQG